MLVADASVLAPALADDGTPGQVVRRRLRPHALVAPAHVHAEVLAVLRRAAWRGLLSPDRARAAVHDLQDLPLRTVDVRSLLRRSWELRADVSAYDAPYVALAEALDVPLLTADARLSRASGVRCAVELLPG